MSESPCDRIQASLLFGALLCAWIGGALPAHASVDRETGEATSVAFEAAPPAHLEDQEHKTLGVDGSYYLYNPDDPTRRNFYPVLTGRWRGGREGPLLQGEWNIVGQASLRPGGTLFYGEVPEAYLGTSSELFPVQVALGRKLVHWNHLDEKWGMGIWQPRFRWDYIRPESVGLTGLFLNAQSRYVQFTAMGTPLYVPERGVPVGVENGTFTSESPWFTPPPSTIAVLGQSAAIHYNLQIPPMEEILFHPSASFLLRAGEESQGPWISAGYAHKPMNQLLLAYDGYLNLLPNVAEAQVRPRILYHDLYSLEAGFNSRVVRGWVSALWDLPIQEAVPADFTTQNTADALSMSATLEWTVIAGDGASDPGTRLSGSVLRVVGGTAPDSGPLAQGGGSVFDSRYPFSSAASIAFESSLRPLAGSWGRRVSASMSFLQDLATTGQILSADFRVRPARGWVVSFGADILGSDSPVDDIRAGYDFIGKYRANDRVHAGVAYAF